MERVCLCDGRMASGSGRLTADVLTVSGPFAHSLQIGQGGGGAGESEGG